MKRIESDNLATIGFLSIDGTAKCFTLEDAFHVAKIHGQTRIPSGEYEIKLRNDGTVTKKYEKEYGSKHKGMLWLQDVPGYKYIYIHIGNNEKHTDGCILVGMAANMKRGRKTVSYSEDAYRKIYSLIADCILSGEKVYITIEDEQG